ncbi:MAG: GNAT family N-acetyltransferase [Gammaproteobacteria bacterium]|nr:GNAT family N-acetyltransferase [Gammaproteobacteria bacterium]
MTHATPIQKLLLALQQSSSQHHRQLLWLEGSQAQCAEAASQLIVSLSLQNTQLAGAAYWVGGGAGFEQLLKRARELSMWPGIEQPLTLAGPGENIAHIGSERDALRLLGTETRLVFFDAHHDFDPNLFAICAGTLVGSGLLVLLTPTPEDWPQNADAFTQRTTPALRSTTQPAMHTSFFIRRLLRQLQAASAQRNVLEIQAHEFLAAAGNPVSASTPPERTPAPALNHTPQHRPRNTQQQIASGASIDPPLNKSEPLRPNTAQAHFVNTVIKLCAQQAGSVVLVAERGRGKSTALAFALQQILAALKQSRCWPEKILLVTPHRHTTQAVLRALDRLYAGNASALDAAKAAIKLLPPDAALSYNMQQQRAAPQTTLLLVDEAAAISLAVLAKLRAAYPRQVMATTIAGYEGSGSGFAQRFAELPGTTVCQLLQPIRWAPDDPLESFCKTLMCAAPIAKNEPERHSESFSEAGKLVLSRLTQAELANDEQLLRSTFELLTSAHYQTEPRDLRLLLDAPYMQIWLARCNGSVVGALMAIEEGGAAEDDPLLADILAARRRPRGNLAAQRLAALSNDRTWLCVSSLRISRVAVAPEWRRRGIASALYSKLRQSAATQNGRACAYISSSFAFRGDLMPFWQSQGAAPVAMGMRLDKASGARSMIVVDSVDVNMRAKQEALTQQLAQDMQFWLPRFFAELAEQDLAALRAFSTSFCAQPGRNEAAGESRDLAILQRFASSELAASIALPALARSLGRFNASAQTTLPVEVRARLNACLRIAPDWASLAVELAVAGRKATQALLRSDVRNLLESYTKSAQTGPAQPD